MSNLWRLFERARQAEGNRTALKISIVGDVSLADRAGEAPFSFEGEVGPRRPP